MGRPRVVLNCASSLDGRIAAPDGRPLRLSDAEDLRRVHGLRARCDAILVGVGTVLADDPALRVKPEHGPPGARDPLRVVLDTRGRTPPGARCVDGGAPSLVLHGPAVADDEAARRWPRSRHRAVPLAADGRLDLAAALDAVAGAGARSVLVEGGGHVLRAFVEAGLADEFTVYVAPVLVGGTGPGLWPGTPAQAPRRLRLVSAQAQGEGVLLRLAPPVSPP